MNGSVVASFSRAANRRGMTLIELLILLVVIGAIARIVVPNVQQTRIRAHAARVEADVFHVRDAATRHFRERGVWPPDGRPGETPPELVRYLSEGFTFQQEDYQLDWEHWLLPDGLPRDPEATRLLGVTVTVRSRELGEMLLRILGPGYTHYVMGDGYTFLFEDT